MLQIKGLHSYYHKIHALRDINLHVKQGEILALIGSNGAGKTTLLSCISGIKSAEKGDILYKGKTVMGTDPMDRVKKGITLCPEGRQIFPKFTVSDNLLMGAYTVVNKAEIKSSFERVYDLFPRLKERERQIAGTLSGGEQQMLAIGRALMSGPQLLMLDEPSLGLAPILVEQIFHLIQEIRDQGITLLLIEQNAMGALEIADRAYVIETGSITLEGTGRELLSNDQVIKSYLGG